jgi:hypothetical protein
MYYGKCMIITLKSNIDSILLLKLDNGILLVPQNDTTVQTMLVTHDVEFVLEPRNSFSSKIYAMCTEFHDAAPSIFVDFEIGEMAESNLVRLSRYIEKLHLQNMIGQHAVWAFTDQVSEQELINYGADSNSLSLTSVVLDSVQISSKLKKVDQQPEVSVAPQSDSIQLTTWIYIGFGVILLFLFITIIRRTSKKQKSSPNS